MSGVPEPSDIHDWQPATSQPGELYTVEGEIRASGAFARGITNDDPRLKPYRRSMWRTGLVFVGIAVLAAAVVAAIAAIV